MRPCSTPTSARSLPRPLRLTLAHSPARLLALYTPVLSLITLPNLLLTYAQHLATPASPAPSPPAPAPAPAPAPEADEDATPSASAHQPTADAPSLADQPQPGELDVTPEFLESFEALLERENVELRFSVGDWAGMDAVVRGGGRGDAEGEGEGQGYDLVLTSETVYAVESLPALLDLLEAATAASTTTSDSGDALCLVACKRIYFGVGGGELEFRRRVEARGGVVEAVWGEGEGRGKSSGVGRTVMRVRWKGE